MSALKGARSVPEQPPDETAAEALEPPRKTFTQFLQEQRRGLLHSELTDRLAEAGRAVREHGKPATLTLTVRIAPAKYDGAVEVSDDVKVKLPEADRDAGLFYPDEHGNLNRNDPRQPELPLHIAPGQAGQTRSAS